MNLGGFLTDNIVMFLQVHKCKEMYETMNVNVE